MVWNVCLSKVQDICIFLSLEFTMSLHKVLCSCWTSFYVLFHRIFWFGRLVTLKSSKSVTETTEGWNNFIWWKWRCQIFLRHAPKLETGCRLFYESSYFISLNGFISEEKQSAVHQILDISWHDACMYTCNKFMMIGTSRSSDGSVPSACQANWGPPK